MSAGRWDLVRRTLQACGAAVWRLPPDRERTVFLTFDDGPHPLHTPQVLAALREQGARACFFMTGLEAERYPEIVRNVVQAGHGVANHGFLHLSARNLSHRGYVANAERGQAALEAVIGCRLPRLFRPPHGRICLRGWLTLRCRGTHFVLWSHDSGDGEVDGDGKPLRAALALGQVASGQILLLHDDHAHGPGELSRAIADLRRAGFRFGRLDEVLSSRLVRCDPAPSVPVRHRPRASGSAEPAENVSLRDQIPGREASG